jgi:hypothetical protein
MAWGRGRGFGMGMAWRRGAGWGAGFAAAPPAYSAPPYAAPTREQELEAMRAQADWLKEQLDAVTKRVAELEKE